MIAFLIPLIIALVVAVASFAIMPKPKQPKPPAVEDAQAPTASAGLTIPIPFGGVTIKGTNVLWYGEGTTYQYKVDV